MATSSGRRKTDIYFAFIFVFKKKREDIHVVDKGIPDDTNERISLR